MNKQQLDLLIKYINGKFEEYCARDSSDGGLIESQRLFELERELYESLEDGE